MEPKHSRIWELANTVLMKIQSIISGSQNLHGSQKHLNQHCSCGNGLCPQEIQMIDKIRPRSLAEILASIQKSKLGVQEWSS
ncbi:hypothetical protein Tco_1334050, partial [Tanacetum coccineum]